MLARLLDVIKSYLLRQKGVNMGALIAVVVLIAAVWVAFTIGPLWSIVVLLLLSLLAQ